MDLECHQQLYLHLDIFLLIFLCLEWVLVCSVKLFSLLRALFIQMGHCQWQRTLNMAMFWSCTSFIYLIYSFFINQLIHSSSFTIKSSKIWGTLRCSSSLTIKGSFYLLMILLFNLLFHGTSHINHCFDNTHYSFYKLQLYVPLLFGVVMAVCVY